MSAKLLDFGLARMAEAETLTAQGDVPGTLAYISPERLAGDAATEAADVWAVGVMLWESLAGRHPFWQTLDARDRARDRGGSAVARHASSRPAEAAHPARRPCAVALPVAAAVAPPISPARSAAPRCTAAARRARGLGLSVPVEAGRAGAAALAAAFAGWTAASLPFYPHGWAARRSPCSPRR